MPHADALTIVRDPAPWHLHLGHTPHVRRPDGRAEPLAPRDAALLAWLALEGATSRIRLASLMWPGSDAEAARNTLRQRLFQLRRQFDRELVAGRATLELAAGVTHDLHEADGVLGDDDSAEAGSEFALWLAQQRLRRRDRTRQSLAELSALAERASDWADALSHAQELLALDRLSEEAHRRVMRLHYLAGDRAAALLAFDRCERVLKDEVGATPAPETLALLHTVEQSAPPPRLAEDAGTLAVARVPASVLRPPRLLGRAREIDSLAAAWQRRQLVLVLGDGGLGKTRLVSDFALGRVGVLLTGARPGDAGVAYASASRLLRQLPAQALERLDSPLREGLACLLPELGPAAPLRSEADRTRFFNAVAAALDSAAVALQGCVVDDLHFADEASLELIRYLVGATRCRWVLAARETEVSAVSRAWLQALCGEAETVVLRLQPLTLAQVTELIDSLQLPSLDGATHARALLQHTGGNPLYLLEAVKSWLASGETDAAAHLPASVNVNALIERRINRLSVGAVQLARCAAVATPDFDIELAAHVLGLRTLDLADPWAELEAAQVLHDGAFAHDLIYEAALASVPGPVARQLHAEIAGFMAERGGEPVRLASHWAQARHWSAAAQAYLTAAQRALDAGRPAEHCQLLEQAAQNFALAGDTEARFAALLQRAGMLVSNDLGAQAQAAVVALEHSAGDDAQQLSALRVRLDLATMRAEVDEVLRLAPLGLAAAQAQGQPELALRFALAWSGALLDARRTAEGVSVLEPHRDWVQAHADLELQWTFAMAHALALDYDGHLREAALGWQQCQALARQAGRPDLLWQSMSNGASGLAKMGRVRQAVELSTQARQLAQANHQVGPLRWAASSVVHAHRLRDLGRYAEALPLLEDGLQAFTAEGSVPDIAMTQCRLALLFMFLGQPARAQPLLAADVSGLPPGMAMIRRVMQGDLASHLGGDGVGPMREALAAFPNRDDVYHRVGSLFAAGVLPADEGEAMAASLASWAALQERLGLAMSGHVRAASRAADQGAWMRGLVHAEAALALEREHQPDSFYLAELWWAAGRVYVGLGRMDEARRVLERGRAWVMGLASEHVPEAFRAGFLQRNPVNVALLALAQRVMG